VIEGRFSNINAARIEVNFYIAFPHLNMLFCRFPHNFHTNFICFHNFTVLAELSTILSTETSEIRDVMNGQTTWVHVDSGDIMLQMRLSVCFACR